MNFFTELKRRNVFRVGIAYVLVAWIVLQGVDFLVQLIGAPAWVLQILFALAAIGLLGVLIFSWVYEMTPEGLKRESEIDRSQSITPHTGRKLDRVIIVFLAVAVAVLLGERFLLQQEGEPAANTALEAVEAAPASPEPATPTDRSVAVLPFVAMSSGEDDEFFADGLTEEILNSLAQLPELLVTARTSAFTFKGQDLPVQEIANKLGVRHIVEGSVRRGGERLRVTAQLIRAADGFHLWSENYDSKSTDVIQVQEDIAEKIAAALDVVLDDQRREAMKRAGLRDVEAFIAFQKGQAAFDKAHGQYDQVRPLLESNRFFEQVLARVPGYPPALIMHADAYSHMLTASPWVEPPHELYWDLDEARQNARLDLTAAAENARNFDEREAIEFDLSVSMGEFRGLSGRLERLLEDDSCIHPTWLDSIATVFGYAERLEARLAAILACDPLQPTVVFSQARAALWSGRPETTLEIIAQARENMSHTWFEEAELGALIVMGRFETATSRSVAKYGDDYQKLLVDLFLASAQGQREQAELLLVQFETHPKANNFDKLRILARLGKREEANRLAAMVDERSKTSLPLVLAALWCNCGAPFDLEAVPNFAADLQQGGLSWPPPTLIDSPLKDW